MKILITGATGFIGQSLMPKLIRGDHELLAITRNSQLLQDLITGGHVESISCESVEHQYFVNKVSEFKPEVVIHLASYLTSADSYQDLTELIQSNIVFLTDVLDALKQFPPQLFINTGTFAEYFSNDLILDPAYLYAATKTASRCFLNYYSEAYKFKYITVVPFSVYGPNDSKKKLMDYLIDSAVSAEPIDFTEGAQKLDFIHVDDVSEVYMCLIEKYKMLQNGESFFAGTGKGTSIRDLVHIIEKTGNKKLNVNWGAKPYRMRDVMNAVAPLEKNNKNIMWNAKINLEQGIFERLKNL